MYLKLETEFRKMCVAFTIKGYIHGGYQQHQTALKLCNKLYSVCIHTLYIQYIQIGMKVKERHH